MRIFWFHLSLLVAGLLPSLGMEVRFLAWDDAVAARKIALVSKGNEEVTPLNSLQRTGGFKVEPTEAGIALQALDRKNAEGKPVLFSAKLPTGMIRPLIILIPDEKAPAGLAGLAIEDSDTSFAWGSFRVVNTTPKSLALGLGKERKVLPVGWQSVDFKPAAAKGAPVLLTLSSELEKPLFTSVWKPKADIRYLVIVVPGKDERLGPVDLRVIPEDRRAVAPTEAAAVN